MIEDYSPNNFQEENCFSQLGHFPFGDTAVRDLHSSFKMSQSILVVTISMVIAGGRCATRLVPDCPSFALNVHY